MMDEPVEDTAIDLIWRVFSMPKRVDFGLGKASLTVGTITDPDKDEFLHAIQIGRLLTPNSQVGDKLPEDSLSEECVVLTFQNEEHSKAVMNALLGINVSKTTGE